MNALASLILRFPRWVAILGTAIAFVGAYYSVLLYKNLKTDFEELLPTTARSVVDLKEVSLRLESIDNLGVLIFSQDTQASRRWVDDLSKELQKVPSSVIASVEYKIDRELEFFQKRQALYLELADLKKIRNYIRDRIQYERELYNPLNIFAEKEIPEPQLDFEKLRQKYTSKTSAYSRFPGGYYATPDEKKRVILVYKPGGLGMDATLALKKAVVAAIQKLDPKSYAADLDIQFTGGVQDQIEEHEALIEDLELSTAIVTLLVILGMWFYYRNIRATGALMASLFMGTFWTFGVSYFAVGYLNANSAFMGSIVIGNGINFGIIFLARYLEERRRGNSHDFSIRQSMVHSATSTWTAALAAGLSYGSLILTGFRGFKQFGIIGLIGMVLCWISAFTLLPAYLTWMNRRKDLLPPGDRPPTSYLASTAARFVQKFSSAILVASLAATAVSIYFLSQSDSQILETNLGQLRNKHSLEKGSAFLSQHQDEIFQRYLSPMVVLPQDRKHTEIIAERLKEIQKTRGEESLIHSVQTLKDFFPTQQPEKVAVLQEIRKLLPPKFFYRLSLADQKKVQEFLTPEVQRPFTEAELPPLLLSKFTEKNGTVGKLVLIEPPLTQATWEGKKIINLVQTLRETADAVQPQTAVAGPLTITADMIASISEDGPKATLFAFIAVVMLVILLFRSLPSIFLTLFALLLGILWLAGLILGFGIKINFLNFIALPITFGIGVDYGVNMFQRYKEEKADGILKVIRTTGGAVGLCSFTTVVGYLSLLIASNKGFVSFGLLAVAGELTCVLAAIFTLPAFLLWMGERRKSSKASLS